VLQSAACRKRREMLAQFQRVGSGLFAQGFVSSQSGNLSIRRDDHLLITQRQCALGSIGEADLVEVGVAKNTRATPLASSELTVHRCIYRKTPALAVVHAHPPYAVALSFMERHVVPCDMEGRSIAARVAVLGKGMTAGPGELGEEIAAALRRCKVVLVEGHGTFAIGQLLEEAYYYTTAFEQSCRILYLLKGLMVDLQR